MGEKRLNCTQKIASLAGQFRTLRGCGRFRFLKPIPITARGKKRDGPNQDKPDRPHPLNQRLLCSFRLSCFSRLIKFSTGVQNQLVDSSAHTSSAHLSPFLSHPPSLGSFSLSTPTTRSAIRNLNNSLTPLRKRKKKRNWPRDDLSSLPNLLARVGGPRLEIEM